MPTVVQIRRCHRNFQNVDFEIYTKNHEEIIELETTMGLLKVIIRKIKTAKDPIGYWRSKGAKIGSGCSIVSNVSFGSEPYLITIGDNVRLTENVRLITHDGGVWVARHLDEKYKNADLFGKITIGNNVHIGVNAVIMPGVTIGDNVIIGCCAVVTRDIPDNSVAVGVPARVIETVDEYVDKNKNGFVYTKHFSEKEKKAIIEERKK